MEVTHNNKKYKFIKSANTTDDICHMCACKNSAELCKDLCFGSRCYGYWLEVKPMRIYISGPMTGLPNNNVDAFEKAELDLKGEGFFVVNPAKNGLPPIATWKQHMVRDIENLLTCEAIFFLKGWEKSKGARIEACVASTATMKMFFQEPPTESLIVCRINTCG